MTYALLPELYFTAVIDTMSSAAASASAFTLPKNEQGEVDWNTLGATLVDNLVAESICLNRLDKKYGELPSSAVVPVCDSNWKLDYEKDDVLIFKKKTRGSKLTCFAGRGLVDAPHTVVGEFMTDPESSFLWDKFLVESKYLKVFAQNESFTDYLGYQRFSSSHCFSFLQRDILCYVRSGIMNGKFVHSAISVEDEKYPPHRFIPRCDVHLGTGMVVEPFRGNPNRSLVNYFGHIDLHGLPLFIMNQVMRMYPMSIKLVRRNFECHQSVQGSSDQTQTTASLSPPLVHSPTFPPPSLQSSQQHQSLLYQDDLSLSMFLANRH